MNAIAKIIERASKLNGTVVLPEGQDPRVITAACAAVIAAKTAAAEINLLICICFLFALMRGDDFFW